MKIEKVTTREEFHRLEPVWNTLLERSTSNTIALTFEWLTTWWDVFGQDRELCILVVRDGAEVIGIAPLVKRTVQYYGLLPYRRIEFLASGEEEADEVCSEYLDFVILPGREEQVLKCVLDYLRDWETGWDELLLTNISSASPNLSAVASLSRSSGMTASIASHGAAIFRDLPATWDHFLNSLSRDFRKKVIRDLRTLEAESGELLEIDTEDSFHDNFRLLVDLHQSRWNAQGKPGVFSSAKFCSFHERLAPKLLRKGWLKLFVMRARGEAVAALYDFVYAGKIYYYQSGFKNGASKLNSPGILVRTLSIRSAIEHGLTECDFLKGRPGSYKFRWGGTTRPIARIRIAKANSKEAIFSVATTIASGLRQVKRVLSRAAAL